MELLIAIKSFIVVFVCIKSIESKALFDYDLQALHTQLNNRINGALQPFGVE